MNNSGKFDSRWRHLAPTQNSLATKCWVKNCCHDTMHFIGGTMNGHMLGFFKRCVSYTSQWYGTTTWKCFKFKCRLIDYTRFKSAFIVLNNSVL